VENEFKFKYFNKYATKEYKGGQLLGWSWWDRRQ
jgi:hypothetical protein